MSRTDLPYVMRNNRFIGMVKYVVSGNGKATVGDIETYIDKHYEELSAFAELGVFSSTKPKISIGVVFIALYWAFISGVSGEEIKTFFEVLKSGMASSPKEYPIIAYRNYLLESTGVVRITDENIKLCQGALKKYITGSCLKRIYAPKELIWTAKEQMVTRAEVNK